MHNTDALYTWGFGQHATSCKPSEKKLWCWYQSKDILSLYLIKHHAMKMYRGSTTPNFGTRWSAVSFTPPLLYLNCTGPQCRSEHYGEEKNFLRLPGIEHRLLSRPIVINFHGFLVPNTAPRSLWRSFTQRLEQNSLLKNAVFGMWRRVDIV
jgi:hypothetical protein